MMRDVRGTVDDSHWGLNPVLKLIKSDHFLAFFLEEKKKKMRIHSLYLGH